MKTKAAIVIGVLVVAAAFVVLQHRSATSYEFVNVGGESNQCECTKRIERTEDSWLSFLSKPGNGDD